MMMLWTLRSSLLRPCVAQRRLLSFTPTTRLPRITSHHARPSRVKIPTKDPEAAPHVTSFREVLAETEAETLGDEVRHPPSIRNQILFFLFGSTLAFGVAARWTNEDTLFWSNKLAQTGLAFKLRLPTNKEMMDARLKTLVKWAELRLIKLNLALRNTSDGIRSMALYLYKGAAEKYLNASEERRACWAIVAVNGLVWAAWAVPGLNKFMMRHFTHHPLSGRSYTMLTSVFSHESFFHLLFNCMALTSFGSAAALYFHQKRKEDPTKLRESRYDYHFVAFYIAAGIFASLVSHVASARLIYPRLLAAASKAHPPGIDAAKVAAKKMLPSLGASGAVYAAVAVSALAFPDAQISLIFLPLMTFPITYGFGAMVALDVFGILKGWALFDHYAHLGGATFGALYYMYGEEVWEWFRRMTLGSLPPSLSSAVWTV